uniref:Uncharacterized protein n=1 Tax=Trepomonas sp. PC1 TaxID=1076344 RepID=A0A146KA79_9EUKA|eukprot:JAP92635.1 Hypothetical protein TPC1_15363 [Trepomonas sp. PC1]
MDNELLALIYATLYTESKLLLITEFPLYLPQFLVQYLSTIELNLQLDTSQNFQQQPRSDTLYMFFDVDELHNDEQLQLARFISQTRSICTCQFALNHSLLIQFDFAYQTPFKHPSPISLSHQISDSFQSLYDEVFIAPQLDIWIHQFLVKFSAIYIAKKEESLFQLINAFDQIKILTKAIALMKERDFVLLEDVKGALLSCMGHKVVAEAVCISREAAEGLKINEIGEVVRLVAGQCELQ